VLADEVEAFVSDASWVSRFGVPRARALERWGRVTSLRVRYADGLEVEFGFAAPDWAAAPLDAGTRRVLEGGVRVVFDRGVVLRAVGRG
jgi:hypothetical protein